MSTKAACTNDHMLPPASVAGVVAAPGSAIYSASKFAVEGITDSLRLEVYGFAGWMRDG